MAATAPRTSGRPQTNVISPPRSPSARQAPITSSERSIFHCGLSSAVTSVKSALARSSPGSPSSGRANETWPKYSTSTGPEACPSSDSPPPLGSAARPVTGTNTRPPQPRSGNHLMVSGSSGAPASAVCRSQAFANSSVSRSAQRP